ncbi:MAG TPA: hypothetical protein VIF62_04220, partial [Labilithrix sp.]
MTRATELLDLCRASLAAAGEPNAEVWLRARRRGHARFSASELSQHMDLDETEARVRVARGLRVAEVTLTDHDRDALIAAIGQAATLATTAPEQRGWPGFSGAARYTPCIRFAEATAQASAAERAELVARVIGAIGANGLASAGVLETSASSVAIATTTGCAAADDGTRAELRLWALADARGRGASGHASHLVRDVRDLAVDRLVEEAVRAAKDGADPGSVDAGTWDVVLEATAVAELLEWLATITFAAPDVEQGTSVLADGLEKAITGA